MKKILITLVVLFSISNVFAQDKEYRLTLEDGKLLGWYDISPNGNIFLITRAKRSAMKNTPFKLHKINSDFTNGFINDMKYEDFVSRGYQPGIMIEGPGNFISKNGNYIKWGKILVNGNDGSQKDYKFDDNEITGNVHSIFSFLSDNYHTNIGPQKGRKNIKKKYEEGDIYIFSRNNADYTTIEKQLIQPPLATNIEEGGVSEWHMGERFENYFNLVTKSDIDEERTTDINHLISYKYTGELVSNISLTVNLDKHHFIFSSNYGAPVFHDYNYGSFGPNNVYTDTATRNYYVYGFYTDKPKKKMISGKYLGFYLFKFDTKGNLIWKKNYSLEGKKIFNSSWKAYQVSINHYKLNQEQIGIEVNADDTSLIYKINTKSGEITKENEVKYKVKKAIAFAFEVMSMNSYRYNKHEFPNKFFSPNALSIIYLNDKIYEYVKDKKSDHKLFYGAKLLDDGSAILVEFDKDNRNLDFYKYD